ncbi:MAG: hypothetical protein ACD_57C00116G0001 [uncultured bacterium]|nr:MAG: hypothetical protein ACD_57C00116G0001 [uncultured bacterium]
MNILVTGGAGFIGSHVTRQLLDAGHKVVVVDNLSCGKKESVDSRAQFIEADIRNIPDSAFKNVDSVIHMAGLIIVPESVEDPIKYADNNVIGTIGLLESMRKNGVKKIIFSSSACVYGTPDTLPIKEDAPVRPDNPYGASKAAIEAFLQAYNANFNFDVTILRYFNPYGPGEMHEPETHAIPNFIKAALSKKPIPLYWNGAQIRDFIYIEDLVRAHVEVINQTGLNIFNIGTEKGVVVKEVLDEIFSIIGYKVPIDDLGKRPGDVQANYASSEKLKKAVGWQAKVDLKEGLKKTIGFYRSSP